MMRIKSHMFSPKLRALGGFLMAGFLVAFAPLPVSRSTPTERTFQVRATSFEFAPAVLNVNPGDRVTIELISTDVFHGLYPDGYGLQVTSDPGQTASLTFIADRPGSYRFRCSVTCGDLHPFMIGKLRVGSNTLLWRSVGLTAVVMAAAVWYRRQ